MIDTRKDRALSPTFAVRLVAVSLLSLLLLFPVLMLQPVYAAGTADLSVSMVAEKKSLKFGDSMTLTATTTNNGPDVATGVELRLGVSDSFANFGGACPDGSVSNFCEIGTLPPGASATVEFKVGAICCNCCPEFVGMADASVVHDAEIADPVSTNDSVSIETRLKGKPPF
jgi:Domain of unknown function DUF11